ncbi:MAG TPA: adenosine kinase [Malonomonas sp.]
MKKYQLCAIGNALVDMEFKVEDSFLEACSIDKGVMTLVAEQRQDELVAALEGHPGKWACGGSAANTVIAAAQFGADCFYSCKLAADESGDFYLRDMHAAGVASNADNGRSAGKTGKCLVMVTPDAERTMNTYLGISEGFSVAELDAAAIAAADYLYIEGYLVTSPSGRAAAIEAKRLAEAAGVKTALTFSDPAMVQFFKDGLAEMIGDGVDLLFCNQAEALAWTDCLDLDLAVEELSKIAKSFAITLGAQGALLFDGTEIHQIAPHPITAVDSNGAGDMFAGALLFSLSRGDSFADAGRLASLASAKVVQSFGPRLQKEEQSEILTAVFGAARAANCGAV